MSRMTDPDYTRPDSRVLSTHRLSKHHPVESSEYGHATA
ncbi:uncharacterized protein G2W53_036203 [Senna tora]|uniref:Uncharacterized protein n=1 Tax=Senna tora TaxID=362788 RepID=A0A834SVG3_9FABA|nr:uncharacterized protein G2W53_036203 [Senna tora]